MKGKKSIWTSVTGSLTSAGPILLSCCKSGACIGVCASPIASIFGLSSASLASSPVVSLLEPLFIAVSAISFTISYYSIYVLPKLNCKDPADCACEPTTKENRKIKINKAVFWIGLILSLGFLSYFEYSKFSSDATAGNADCSVTGCGAGEISTHSEENCANSCDSASSCCEDEQVVGVEKNLRSEITCPKCGHKEIETLPTEVCLIKYTCKNCKAILFPKADDCCVFCSYGDHKCPSKKTTELSCKLGSAELQKRKETVIAKLKTLILDKKELKDGYSFKFPGDDKTIDLLSDFVKSERQCCDFFSFSINIIDAETIWFDISGPDGAKDFIKTELKLM